jgi:hypothetical protein
MKDKDLKLEEIEFFLTLGGLEGVDDTLLSDTLQSVGLRESSDTRSKVWFRQKNMNLCT